MLQRFPLPIVPGEGEHVGPCGGSLLSTPILRGIVYHNDRQVGTCGQHDGRNGQCFVMHRDNGYDLIHLHPHCATSLASCRRPIRIAVWTPPGARPCTKTTAGGGATDWTAKRTSGRMGRRTESEVRMMARRAQGAA